MKNLTDLTRKFKGNQTTLLVGVVGFMAVVIIGLVTVLVSGPSLIEKPKASYSADLSGGAARMDAKEVWAEKFAMEHEAQGKRIEAMEKILHTLAKINQPSTPQEALPAPQQTSTPAPLKPQGNPIGNEVQGIREEIKSHEKPTAQTPSQNAQPEQDIIKTQGITSPGTPSSSSSPLIPLEQGGASSVNTSQRFRSKGIQRTVIALMNAKTNKNLKSVDNTIPAGAFAGAVMVGGVDASTSIQATNDPRPVLLRITDHGTLPRKFKSDLCGCHVLAACYGDISSERVYMRLEKLTCTERKTGEVVEMSINGYVAGEDGRAGLRGVVVDRAGESMRNAAIGGFLSGMGNFLSQSHSPITFSPANGLAQTNPMTNPEMLRSGATKGASGALEKYAEFYIKRAEQLQPVIQIQAGRKVDVVFTQGVAFESSAARGEMIRVNDQQRLSQLQQSTDSQKPVEAWIPNQEQPK